MLPPVSYEILALISFLMAGVCTGFNMVAIPVSNFRSQYVFSRWHKQGVLKRPNEQTKYPNFNNDKLEVVRNKANEQKMLKNASSNLSKLENVTA